MIANNKQIAQMIRLQARTKADLAQVSGIGDAKVARYGNDLLKTLAQHLERVAANDLENDKEPNT